MMDQVDQLFVHYKSPGMNTCSCMQAVHPYDFLPPASKIKIGMIIHKTPAIVMLCPNVFKTKARKNIRETYRSYSCKQKFKNTWRHSTIGTRLEPQLVYVAQHCVSLPTSSLQGNQTYRSKMLDN